MFQQAGGRAGRKSRIVGRPPLIRGTFSVANNGNATLTLPAGSQAGDDVYIFNGGGYQMNSLTGGALLYTNASSGHNHQVWKKTLTAADVATGSLTAGMAGSFAGAIAMIVFIGATRVAWMDVYLSLQTADTFNNFNWTTPREVTPDDLFIAWLSCRNSSTLTSSNGTRVQYPTQANASGALFTFPPLEQAGHIESVFNIGTPQTSYNNPLTRLAIRSVQA